MGTSIIVGELDPGASPKVLIIVPHADDEAFGCGGMMAEMAVRGAAVELLVFAVGGIHHRHLEMEATLDTRIAELDASCGILSVQKYSVLYPGKDMQLDTIPQLDMVGKLDKILDRGQYDQVFYPYPSHNHDHATVHRACVAALRPGARCPGPSLIAMCDYIYSAWSLALASGGRMYVDITETIETKCEAIQAYTSQLRLFPNPMCVETIELVARMRGMESGYQYAELFHIVQKLGCHERHSALS